MEYTEEEFFHYKDKAERVAADYNFHDAIPLAQWLRKNGWLTSNSPARKEAMDKIQRMSEGAYEVVEKYVDDNYRWADLRVLHLISDDPRLLPPHEPVPLTVTQSLTPYGPLGQKICFTQKINLWVSTGVVSPKCPVGG